MSVPSMLLVGAGGHARACIDVVERDARYVIGGLVGLPAEVGSSMFGYRVIGSDADLPALLRGHAAAVVTIGHIKTPDPRMRAFEMLQRLGCELPCIVSPLAHVSRHAALGAGTIVMHGAVVNAGAVIGRNCIVNSQALIEHDVVVGDHCHVSTAACVNSGVRIGAGTFIGSTSAVRQCITIGARCVIGMGQCVVSDCDAGTWIPLARKSS